MTTPSEPPFKTIGRYQIQSLLGRGGMGEVYKAFDPGLDRTVALKTIRADADNPSFLDRLYREAKACGRLHHPRIVTIHDIGEAEGVVFIAMEYLEGENLSAAMARGDLGFELKITMLTQILEALQYAHGEGVIHRDIKPANVHVLPDRSIKLVDFGLARVTRAESLTMSGAIMGTPYYMSPEQLKGQKVDGRSDIYSTGVLAYELFTRRRAFEGESITTVMLKVLSETPPPMDTAWSAKFPEIEKIVNRAIAKNADDRYPTAEDMKNALTAFLASSRDAIVRSQADVTIQSQRAVAEVKTLIAKGEHARSEAILAETLRLDPDAKEARALWEQATQLMPSPAPQPVAPEPAKTVVAPVPDRQPVVKPPVPPVAEHPAPPPVVPHTAPPPVRPPQQTPGDPDAARSRSGLWLALGLVAVGVVALVAYVSVNGAHGASAGSLTTSAPPASASPAIAASSPAPQALPSALPPADPPAVQVAQTPTAQTTQASAATTPATAAQVPAPAGRAGGTSSAAAAASHAVRIDAAGTDAAMTTALTAALKARGVTVAAGAGAARVSVRASAQVTVRQSSFQGNSALTADYVGTLQIQNLATSSRDTLSFDGHALEFGEPVVRAAAIHAAADQMAEAIEKAVRD